MFGIIALGVFSIWLFHKDTVDSLRFGSDFIITVKLRSMEVKNLNGDIVLYGEMGHNLDATPYDNCFENHTEKEVDNCVHWRNVASLSVSKQENSSLSCYTIQWESYGPGIKAIDCFYLQRYNWYGYLTNTSGLWPISDVYIKDVNYYTEYPEEQPENLVPIWFGQQGISIFVHSGFPFSLSWNVTDERQFCIASKLEAKVQGEPVPQLRYTICQSETLKEVVKTTQQHRQEVDTDFSFKQKHKHLLLNKPIHSLTARENMKELLEQIQKKQLQCSLMELFDNWEEEFGNFTFDARIVDEVMNLFSAAANIQCYPILPVSTFFSYKSQYFTEGVSKGYFVRDKQNLVTRMIKWRGQEGAALDVTNPQAEQWYLQHLQRIVEQYKIKALKLLHLSVPSDSKYYDDTMTHLDYTRIFYRDLANRFNVSLVLELATGFIPLPVYTPVRMKFYGEPGSSCLNTSIPFSLMLGLSGFHLLIADADRMADPSTTEEMFIRWLQVAIFFPVLEIPSIPVLRKEIMQHALNETLQFRHTELLPYMSSLWENQPDLPIIRPMWWMAQDDPIAQTISDQFMVGDNLLVAPFLCEGTSQRDVYFPAGSWSRNDTNGTQIITGPATRTVKTDNVSAIPYFWKKVTEPNEAK